MNDDLIKRSDAIVAIHNYWKKRLETLPTKESEYGEVYADIQPLYKILEYNKALCNLIKSISSADRPQGEWIYCEDYVGHDGYECSNCGFFVPWCYDVYADSNFIRHYHTCPHCDSRMKGADDEDN